MPVGDSYAKKRSKQQLGRWGGHTAWDVLLTEKKAGRLIGQLSS